MAVPKPMPLGHAFDARIICGREYFDQRFVTDLVHADHPDSLRTVDDLKGWLESKRLAKVRQDQGRADRPRDWA